MGYLMNGMPVTSLGMVQSLDTYLLILSIVNLVFLFPVYVQQSTSEKGILTRRSIGTELIRRGALTSKIWFELIWNSLFLLAFLGESYSYYPRNKR